MHPKKDKKMISVLLLFITLITIYFLNLQVKLGVVYWDTYIYLWNALMFAGISPGYKQYLPPLIPFLTGMLFKVVGVSEAVLFVICGIIYVLGVLGTYLFLRLRFTTIESFAGTLILSCMSVVLAWMVAGTLDVPGAMLSVWTIFTFVYGMEKNKKFLFFTPILYLLAFLTRYTAGLLVIPILTYLIVSRFKNIKELMIGAAFGSPILISFMYFLYLKVGNPFIFLGIGIPGTPNPEYPGFNLDSFYYLKHILQYISSFPSKEYLGTYLNPSMGYTSPISYVLAFLSILGISLYLKRHRAIYGIIPTIFLTILSLKYQLIYLIPELLLIPCMLFLYSKSKIPKLDLMVFTWFLTYLFAHSLICLKVDRYFITMVIPLTYILMLGISELKNLISTSKYNALVIFLAVGVVISSLSYYFTITPYRLDSNLENAATWLKNYDPNYRQKIIFSDHWIGMSWYLKYEVKRGNPDDFKSIDDLSKMLINSNATYFIWTKKGFELKGFEIIKKFKGAIIYERCR